MAIELSDRLAAPSGMTQVGCPNPREKSMGSEMANGILIGESIRVGASLEGVKLAVDKVYRRLAGTRIRVNLGSGRSSSSKFPMLMSNVWQRLSATCSIRHRAGTAISARLRTRSSFLPVGFSATGEA